MLEKKSEKRLDMYIRAYAASLRYNLANDKISEDYAHESANISAQVAVHYFDMFCDMP